METPGLSPAAHARITLLYGPLLIFMKFTHYWLIGVMAAGLAGCKRQAPPQGNSFPPPQVTVQSAEQRDLVEWEEFTGRVQAKEVVELRPRVSGYIEEVLMKAGQTVKQGDVLFRVDNRIYAAKKAQNEGEVVRAKAALDMAQKEFARVEDLLKARALSPEQAESRTMNKDQAAAMVVVAEATLKTAQLDLEFTEVRAPISGRVSRALVTAGNYVNGQAGTATILTTIVSIDPTYVYADLDENTFLRIQQLAREKKLESDEQGRVPAELQLSNETGFPHRGYIESFDNQLDAGTGSIVIRAEFPNADEKLTPGLFARLRLPVTARHSAVLTEDRAIQTDQARKFVLVLGEGNKAESREVTLGPMVDGRRIVRTGLKGGEMVIVNGHARVHQPGTPVQPVTEPAPVAVAKP
jgi:RND family efflux transporter MFP subunit